MTQALPRIRHAAKRDRRARFTAPLYHITPKLLEWSFHPLRRSSAPGVDGVTWTDYEQGLQDCVRDLHGRVQRGAYRAQPSRRQCIAQADGRERALAIASLEDKVVQRAAVAMLNAIYRMEFLGFSL